MPLWLVDKSDTTQDVQKKERGEGQCTAEWGRMNRYISATWYRLDMFVCDMRKRSNFNLASEKEQMVRVEKMRKCDGLTNVAASI